MGARETLVASMGQGYFVSSWHMRTEGEITENLVVLVHFGIEVIYLEKSFIRCLSCHL